MFYCMNGAYICCITTRVQDLQEHAEHNTDTTPSHTYPHTRHASFPSFMYVVANSIMGFNTIGFLLRTLYSMTARTDKTTSLTHTHTQIGPLYYRPRKIRIIDRLSDLLGNKQKNISPPSVVVWVVCYIRLCGIDRVCADDKDAQNVSIYVYGECIFCYILRILTVKRFTSGKNISIY